MAHPGEANLTRKGHGHPGPTLASSLKPREGAQWFGSYWRTTI
jgi:hypothetical protein